MQRSSYKIVSYKVKHSYDVRKFLDVWRNLLQRAIDIIWDNIKWEKKDDRLIPLIPKSREFKRNLRNQLLKNLAKTSKKTHQQGNKLVIQVIILTFLDTITNPLSSLSKSIFLKAFLNQDKYFAA